MATFCCDVTPPLGEAIYSSYQPLATVEHPLLAKGIVLDDGRHRYVLCAVDWCELCNSTYALFRRRLAEAAATDVSLVAIQTVHQHTAPMGDADAFRLVDETENPPPHVPAKFFEETADRVAAAAKESLGRLQAFDHIATGEAKVDRVASSRRVPGEDGKIRVRWSACLDPALRAEPEGFIDPILKTITLARGDEPLVRLHYYATHPQSFYGDPRASYDFPGIARQRLEEEEKVFQIYFTGCAGDVTAGKYNDRSRQARDELAQRLYDGMKASIAATRLAPVGAFQWRTVPLTLSLREDAGYTLAENLARMADPKAAALARLEAAMAVAFIRRSDRPIELSCLRIGETQVLHLPGEAMIEFQRFAQQLKPKQFVAVAAYGDCGPAYICTQRAYDEGGYEPGASRVMPDSEAKLKAAIRQLLADE
ncbi:MAG: hypothetical protein A2V70_07190 [Planctomycetes bacterium RBG_13_63_9]|nr:MAG: hypothetical protein A2V70_07190 [Planctomycetes bacterium RBG_13_63_9]